MIYQLKILICIHYIRYIHLSRTQRLCRPNKHLINDKCIAIDCEMVGVGYNGIISELARVSIVNYYGVTLMDKYVKPKQKVTDYRTQFSGINPSDLVNGRFIYCNIYIHIMINYYMTRMI